MWFGRKIVTFSPTERRNNRMYTKKRRLFLIICATGVLTLVWLYFHKLSTFYQDNGTCFIAFYNGVNSNYSSEITRALRFRADDDSSKDEIAGFDDDLVVIYNRVPKTGSTSFINLAYDLCKKNNFFVLHINITANMHVLSLPNQVISPLGRASLISLQTAST